MCQRRSDFSKITPKTLNQFIQFDFAENLEDAYERRSIMKQLGQKSKAGLREFILCAVEQRVSVRIAKSILLLVPAP